LDDKGYGQFPRLAEQAQRTFSQFPKSFWFFRNSSMSKQEALPPFRGLVCETV
jgi:hypothetical protein